MVSKKYKIDVNQNNNLGLAPAHQLAEHCGFYKPKEEPIEEIYAVLKEAGMDPQTKVNATTKTTQFYQVIKDGDTPAEIAQKRSTFWQSRAQEEEQNAKYFFYDDKKMTEIKENEAKQYACACQKLADMFKQHAESLPKESINN